MVELFTKKWERDTSRGSCKGCIALHTEIGEKTPCGDCEMPQELRNIDRRTSAADYNITKILNLYNILKRPLPEIVQKMAQDFIWPDMTINDKRLFINSWIEIEEIRAVQQVAAKDKNDGNMN